MPAPINVLVVFYSRYGTTERLALAAGLGAIQEDALIRLRRLPDMAAPAVIDADPAWKAHLARMTRDYVAPRPADPVWADVIVLATPPESCAEVEQYIGTLRGCGPMTGKIAAPLAPGNSEAALRPLYAAAACAGLVVAPADLADDAVTAARLHGRALAATARALKHAAGLGPAPRA